MTRGKWKGTKRWNKKYSYSSQWKIEIIVTVNSEESNDEILKDIKENEKVQELLNSENFVKKKFMCQEKYLTLLLLKNKLNTLNVAKNEIFKVLNIF